MNILKDRIVFLTFDIENGKKVVFLGLSQTGKSTIINRVIKGQKIIPGADYNATINYQRIHKRIYGKDFLFLDLGGQIRFLDHFMGKYSEFVFNDVDLFIFVLEPLKISSLSRAKYYLELSMEKLEAYSPNAEKVILVNKIDLLPPNMDIHIIEEIKSYIMMNLPSEVMFYSTSVFFDSIFTFIGELLTKMTGFTKVITTITNRFITDCSIPISSINLFTEEGMELYSKSTSEKNKRDVLNFSLILEQIKLLEFAKTQYNSIIIGSQLLVFHKISDSVILLVIFPKATVSGKLSFIDLYERITSFSSIIEKELRRTSSEGEC